MTEKQPKIRSHLPRMSWLVCLALLLSIPPAALGFEIEMRTLAEDLAKGIQASGSVHTVAVVDFTDLQGEVMELGRFLAEELSIGVAGAGTGLRVVDRAHLALLLKEHELHATGLLDPATARRLGKIAGVEALITGTLTPFGDSVRLTVKVLNTETAAMISASHARVPKIGAIEGLLAKGLSGGNGREPGNSAPAGQVAPAVGIAPAAHNLPQTQDVHKFIFQLNGCERDGATATCHMVIQNNAPDRELPIYRERTVAFDNQGNEFYPTWVKLANRAINVRDDRWTRKQFPFQVPVQASVTFDAVHPQAALLKRVDINCGDFVVTFRDIALAHSGTSSALALAAGAPLGSAVQAGEPGVLETGLSELESETKTELKRQIKGAFRKLFGSRKLPKESP